MVLPAVTSTGNMILRSRSNRTATTTSIATPKGVSDDGNASTTTKGEQTLASNDASTGDGSVKFAAAIAVAVYHWRHNSQDSRRGS